jgi:hypothetical protein
MTLRSGIFPAIIVLSSFLLGAADRGSAQSTNGFPLKQGTYWIYECVTTRKGVKSPPVQKSLSWRMEILETMRQRDLIIALIRGHLDDLPGPNEPKRRDYLVVAVRDNAFYLVAPPNSLDLLQLLKQSKSDWTPLVLGQAQLFLELPLTPGSGFPTEQGTQENTGPHRPGFDSWLVQDKTRLSLGNLKANVPLGSVEQYSLVFGLNKSEKTVDFVPGVGIAAYDYHEYAGVLPHQAEWEGHCKLVEYRQGGL